MGGKKKGGRKFRPFEEGNETSQEGRTFHQQDVASSSFAPFQKKDPEGKKRSLPKKDNEDRKSMKDSLTSSASTISQKLSEGQEPGQEKREERNDGAPTEEIWTRPGAKKKQFQVKDSLTSSASTISQKLSKGQEPGQEKREERNDGAPTEEIWTIQGAKKKQFQVKDSLTSSASTISQKLSKGQEPGQEKREERNDGAPTEEIWTRQGAKKKQFQVKGSQSSSSSTISQKLSKDQEPGQEKREERNDGAPTEEIWKRQGAKKKQFQVKESQSSSTISQKVLKPQTSGHVIYGQQKEGALSEDVGKIPEAKKKQFPVKDSPSNEPKYQLMIPEPATRGRPIKVQTNYFKINLGDLQYVYHYDVAITPEHKRKYRNIMEQFSLQHFNNIPFVYDNKKNLFTVKEINERSYVSGSTEFEGTEYKVEVKFARIVDLTPLHDIAKSQVTPREAMQVIDIVLRSAPSATLIPAGRSFFVKPAQGSKIIDLKDGMELYSGFYQSSVRGRHLYLNVDVAHKAVPKKCRLTDALTGMFNKIDLKRQMTSWQIQDFNKYLKGLRIVYELPNKPSSKRNHAINELKKDAADLQKFRRDDNTVISVADYFEREKNYKLKYPKLPTVWVGNKNRNIYLPLELCTIEEGQMIRKNLTENNKQSMIKHTTTDTIDRREKIKESLNKADFNNHPTVKEFGFSVEDEFLQLDARVLKPPTVLYKNKKTVVPKDGQWLKGKNDEFQKSATVKTWMLICVDPKNRYLLNDLELQKIGTQIQEMSELKFPAAAERWQRVKGTEYDINEFFKSKKGIDIIFVIIPDRGNDEYAYVKKAAELHSNCVSQCIKESTARNILDDRRASRLISNIMLKDNSKLNGTNHVLSQPPQILENSMVMGADVTHPSPHSEHIPSVAAVTASQDTHAFQYKVCWRLQNPTEEIIKDMRVVAQELLQSYKENNKKLPEKIIYYRDGVSEGQFDKVVENEVRDINAACSSFGSDYRPLITCIVVQKRHHTRLFPLNAKDSRDTNYNVPAGTCVDTEITHPYMQEFYLVSHASIKGVARPTKYCTLVDDNNLSNDDMEELTYYLCHLYSRCNRSVSYPAPTYNAHLAAARAKVYIHKEQLNFDNLNESYEKLVKGNLIRKTNPLFFV